jgi:5-hydroxyisourate hydrolase-like protein (transthyretin family)
VTDVNGNYSLNLPGGRYKLYFFESPLGNPPHYPQWWSNHVSSSRANVVILFADTSEANVELASAVFISGLVTDASDGLPIAGVNVAAMLPTLPCCEIVDNAQTDATGNYRFMAPLGASLKIQFIGSGHITEWWDNKPFFDSADLLVADSNKSGVNAQLARATANSVSGRVTDRATGLPIAGMNVQLDLANVCCQAIGFGAVTDSDGRYTVTLDAPATVKVLFFRVPGGPPYVLRWYHDKDDFNLADSLVVSGAVADVDEVLDAGIVISGQVTDAATAAALLNITVIAQPNFGCCGYGSNTDANGRYNLVVGPGTYRISFFSPPGSDYLEQWWNNKPGYSAADLLTVPSTTVDLTSINAAFVHGILVRGTVTGAAGAAVGQVDVVATLDDPAIPCCLSYRAQTGTDGTYTMYVRAGHYRINFQPPSTTDYLAEYWDGKPDFGSASVLNVVGSTEGIDASLDRGFRITGRVTDANGGAGVPNVFVGVNDVICCTSGGYGFTGADGTYSATVRAGTYTLAFNPPFGSDFVLQYWNNKPTLGTANHLVVDASKPNIDAVLGHGFRLAGRISDAGDPAIPLPGANVSAYTVGTFEFVANAAAGSDGTYSLFVPAGDYDLYFNPPYLSDYVGEYWNDKIDQASADVVHVAGPISGLNAGLARAVRISGRVTDETGAPATSVFVSVHKPDAPFAYVTGSSTDDAGRYSVPLSPGSYKMCFFPSYGSPLLPECWNDKENSLAAADPIDVTSSVAGFDVVLARGIVISGRVTSTSGVPLSGAVALIAHGEEACCNFYLGYQTQANGTYSITIAPGSYFVGFSATGYQFQYWNGKTNALTADLLSGAIDHPNTDAALAPIDASPPAGSGPPADGSPPGSSGPPSDGTPPAGSSAPTDGTPGAGSVVADDRTIAMGLPSPSIGAQWSVVMTT